MSTCFKNKILLNSTEFHISFQCEMKGKIFAHSHEFSFRARDEDCDKNRPVFVKHAKNICQIEENSSGLMNSHAHDESGKYRKEENV